MKHKFELYCKEPEKIENYEAAKKDNFKWWDCHHRLETHNSDGERRLVNISAAELKALDMYLDRPASELIFLTRSEHRLLHMNGENNPMRNEDTRKKSSEAHKGKKCSKETKKKMSEAKKGEKNSFYGKTHTEETKKKLSEASKGNKNVRGTRWYNNGKINTMAKECPPGFVPGMLRK